MKARLTLASSICSDDCFYFLIYFAGRKVGELHLRKPIPPIPYEYSGELYLWDNGDVDEENEVKHPGPARKTTSAERAELRAMQIFPSDLLKPSAPKPKPPKGISGNLSKWRKYMEDTRE